MVSKNRPKPSIAEVDEKKPHKTEVINTREFNQEDAIVAQFLYNATNQEEQDLTLEILLAPSKVGKNPLEELDESAQKSRIQSARKLHQMIENLPNLTDAVYYRTTYEIRNVALALIIEAHGDPRLMAKAFLERLSRGGYIADINFLLRGVAERGTLDDLKTCIDALKDPRSNNSGRHRSEFAGIEEEARGTLKRKQVEKEIRDLIAKMAKDLM